MLKRNASVGLLFVFALALKAEDKSAISAGLNPRQPTHKMQRRFTRKIPTEQM